MNVFERLSLARLLLVLCASCVVGCGGGSGSVPVEGKVTLDGQPLAEARVVFSPVRASDPGPFAGTTDAEGRFALTPIDSKRAGAEVGEYFVIITTVETPPGTDELSPPPTQREVVPPEYRNGTMRFEVPEGGDKEIEFAMSTRSR